MAQMLPQVPKGHGGIFGITQSGKTYWALQAFNTWNYHSIFINWQWLPVNKHHKCYTLRDVISTCNNKGKAVFYPNDEEDVDKLLNYIYEVYRKKQYYPIVLFCDEADKYAQQTGLTNVITKGMRFGINTIVISQRPQMLQCRSVLDNLYYFVFFRHSPQFWSTLRERYKINITEDDITYLNNNPYSAIYFNYVEKQRL